MRKKAMKMLTSTTDRVESEKEILNEDGFGLTDFVSNKSTNLSNQNLIKRYNFYSMRVLSTMEEQVSKYARQQKQVEAVPAKKPKIDEEIEDLNATHVHDLHGAALSLKHVDRYFQGLRPEANTTSTSDLALKAQDPKLLCQNTLSQASAWCMDIKPLVNHSLAVSILVDLSPGS